MHHVTGCHKDCYTATVKCFKLPILFKSNVFWHHASVHVYSVHEQVNLQHMVGFCNSSPVHCFFRHHAGLCCWFSFTFCTELSHVFSAIYILEIPMMSSEISHHPLLRHAQKSLLGFPDIINGGTCQELSLLLAFLETTCFCEYLLPICSMIFAKINHIHPTCSAILPHYHSHIFCR